jgi:pyruvate formate lyase activating enzyme
MDASFVRAALLHTSSERGVLCMTCARQCQVAEGARGWCRTRENRGGRLYTLTYGAVSSLACNPIEKKPLYHFNPGSLTLTAGSWSCNLACPWCQNADISKCGPAGGDFVSPERFVTRARHHGCQGTSISFNEPTLSLEWSLDVFRLARDAGLYNTFITNGTMTEPALDLLLEAGLDAMNVDLKGDAEAVGRYCQIDVETVWRTCVRSRERGIWIELTTLVVPGVNDSPHSLEEIARRIVRDLGPDTPWHLSRYVPAYRFHAPPTPLATLERAREIGCRAGLHYVYLGNVPGGVGEQTLCPGCGACLAIRARLCLVRCDVTGEGRCPRCGQAIAGIGWNWAKTAETTRTG